MNLICKTQTVWTLAALFAVLTPAQAAPAAPDPAQEAVPLIVIDNVPLVDAIRNLARHIELNYILDPRLEAESQGPVSIRQTNTTAYAVLSGLLHNRKLTIITNLATSIARIAPAKLNVKPVMASQIGIDNGAVIPLLTLDDVPLSEAISKLAGATQLQLTADPIWPGFTQEGRVPVSFRWQRVTAKQALVALLDNYELLLIEGPAGTPARVAARTRGVSPASPKQK